MNKSRVLLIFALGMLSLFPSACIGKLPATATPVPASATLISATPTKAPSGNDKLKIFTDTTASVGAGIIFDDNGNMFVGRIGQLEKVSPDGKVSLFCDLTELPAGGHNYYYKSPLIWDMAIDADGDILAAAQDRILKIHPDGQLETLISERFEGFLGASGIELDNQGNFYITNGSQIVKYTPDLKKTVFIDSSIEEPAFSSFFSLSFDPDYKNLYVTDFHSKSLIKYPIAPDGSALSPIVLIVEPVKNSGGFGAPLNIVFSENSNIYVSIDGMSQILEINKAGDMELIYLGINPEDIIVGPISNHIIAFGGKGFDEESLFITLYGRGTIYKYKVGEKAFIRP